MGEHHQIAGPARGEPRPAGSTGACVRVPLDAAPSPHWSHLLAAHFARHLCGERRIGHLRLAGLVPGAGVVLARTGGVRVPDRVRDVMRKLARSADTRDAARLEGYRGYEDMVTGRPRKKRAKPKIAPF